MSAGCVLELRAADSKSRVSIEVRHTFADLVRCVDQAVIEDKLLTVIPMLGGTLTFDLEEYRTVGVFHHLQEKMPPHAE